MYTTEKLVCERGIRRVPGKALFKPHTVTNLREAEKQTPLIKGSGYFKKRQSFLFKPKDT